MRVPVSLSLLGLIVLACLSPAAGAAGVPTSQTFTPKGLGVSFTLPADWSKQYAEPGVRFYAAGPGYIGQLAILSGRTTLTLAQQAANFLAFQHQRLAGTKAAISSRPAKVASGAAVLVTARWSPAGVQATDQGDQVELDYLFEHGQSIYVFEYSTTAKWLGKERPVIMASAASIRVALVA